MKYFGQTCDQLAALGALHTAREISQQPGLWLKIWRQINRDKDEIQSFLNRSSGVTKVILTGAGTSGFIGESLVGSFFKNFHGFVQAVPSTDLVSHPFNYFSAEQSVLLISFARSGNSPESKAVMSLADKICKKCHHLIITCNKNGDMAKYDSKNGKYTIILPDESNDQGLAMTSSYTGMLLAGLLISRLDEIQALKREVLKICEYANRALLDYQKIKEIADAPFKRVVFLGSGPFLGTAREAQLKLQELTDGTIICKHDSFLGFRHGPKAVVDPDTLIVYLFSNVFHVSRYENDLVLAMKKGKEALAQVGISENSQFGLSLNYNMVLAIDEVKVDEDFLTIPAIVPAQMLGFYKSLKEGISPDSPSKSGAISRVVEGVTIYEHFE